MTATEIPQKLLSQYVRETVSERKVLAAVFMTYTLEPAFFEAEVVALLAGDSLSQEPKLRLVQLEELLRDDIGDIAVYYCPSGLQPVGSPKLDIRYVPVRIKTGRFHPKVVLLLTEPRENPAPEEQTLTFGVMSANLTQSGWWRNLECARFESIAYGDRLSFHNDLLTMLKQVRQLGGRPGDHDAMDLIRAWLSRHTSQRRRKEIDGRLQPQLLAGTASLPDFLDRVVGRKLRGCDLEVISPYLDSPRPSALETLRVRFDLQEARVFLPTDRDGGTPCSHHTYMAVDQLENTWWCKLPRALVQIKHDRDTMERGVHAKVYRFIRRRGRYEVRLVGSHNLTRAAHQNGGNFEASFLYEPDGRGRAQPWLTEVNRTTPTSFHSRDLTGEDDMDDAAAVVPLDLSYDWQTQLAEAAWHGSDRSPQLRVESSGALLFELSGLPSGKWTKLSASAAEALGSVLRSTAILDVISLREEGQRNVSGCVLVQEENMFMKPALLPSWTYSDILEYWARPTAEQRATMLDERHGTVPLGLNGEQLIDQRAAQQSFFDTYAGIFHAFEIFRKQVLESVKNKPDRHAESVLLGQRHDSLPTLLDRVLPVADDSIDPVAQYLIVLAARQLLQELKERRGGFFAKHRREFTKLLRRTKNTEALANKLDLGADGVQFLKWFEGHFLKRLAAAGITRA